MQIISLETIKQQCRIEPDFTDEDARLTSYGTSAEETMAQYLGRGKTVTEMVASLTEEYGAVPESIKNATLMLVDNWYQHRSPIETVAMYSVPYTFDILIKPYMKL